MDISRLVGLTITAVEGAQPGSGEILFSAENGQRFFLRDPQLGDGNDVTVEVVDVEGDIGDLIGSPIIVAETVTSADVQPGQTPVDGYTFTWVFYRLATDRGFVVIRWLGESNGHYAEEAKLGVC